MKQLIIMLACLLAISAATAQEKKGCMTFELGIGTTNYGNYSPMSVFTDPTDSYVRVAPSYPEVTQIRSAVEIFCICVKITLIKHLLIA